MIALRRLTRTTIAAMWLAAGCAAATTTSGRGNGTQLTQSELAAANSENLYEAIVKLHPEWLSSRGATSMTDSSPTGVDIYMNGSFLGKADFLRDVRLLDVTSVRYWDVGQASARFGMGHPRGVIEITRK
jgi:hypothetical protein